MKQILSNFWVLLMLFSFTASGNMLPKQFVITGKITGLPDGTKLKLIPGSTHRDEKSVAEATVLQGKFMFSGKTDGPRFFNIQLADAGGALELMVDGGQVSIDGSGEFTETKYGKFFNFKDVAVKGSAVHQTYLIKKAPRVMLDSIYNVMEMNNKEISDKLNIATTKKDTVLVREIRNTAAYKKLEKESNDFFVLVEKTYSKMVSDNKDSWWGPFFALNLYSYYTPNEKHLYEELSDQAKKSYYGGILYEEMNPKGFLGMKAPVLDLKASTAIPTTLESVRKGNKYVLVDFWASWCVPCRNAIPAMKAAYADLKANGIEIMSVSIDKKETDWLKAEKEEHLPWPSFLDKGQTYNAWKIKTIPAMFLIDSNGLVVAEKLTLEEVKEKFLPNKK